MLRVTFLKSFFTIKINWDVLPIFTQETIYHMRTEMRQSLVQRLNCGTAELQDKEYSVCKIRTAELKVTAYSLCGSGTVEPSHRIFCVQKRNF